MLSVRKRYEKLLAKVQASADAIRLLQTECGHPNVDKQYRGNTGNYDPSSDSYWIEFSCPDCGKKWSEDQ